jgi:hypothetical protein
MLLTQVIDTYNSPSTWPTRATCPSPFQTTELEIPFRPVQFRDCLQSILVQNFEMISQFAFRCVQSEDPSRKSDLPVLGYLGRVSSTKWKLVDDSTGLHLRRKSRLNRAWTFQSQYEHCRILLAFDLIDIGYVSVFEPSIFGTHKSEYDFRYGGAHAPMIHVGSSRVKDLYCLSCSNRIYLETADVHWNNNYGRSYRGKFFRGKFKQVCEDTLSVKHGTPHNTAFSFSRGKHFVILAVPKWNGWSGLLLISMRSTSIKLPVHHLF